MTSPRGDAPGPTSEDESRATSLGVVLVVVAVVIGVVLLYKGFDQEDGLVGSAKSGDATTTTTVDETAPPLEETTTVPAAKSPAEVSVLVANGSGGTGLAAANAATLESAGYVDVATADAPSQTTSVVYYAEGAQADAAAVARAASITAAPQAMPSPPPVALDGATVLVVLGTDKL